MQESSVLKELFPALVAELSGSDIHLQGDTKLSVEMRRSKDECVSNHLPI